MDVERGYGAASEWRSVGAAAVEAEEMLIVRAEFFPNKGLHVYNRAAALLPCIH